MNRKERIQKTTESHNRYVAWWLPIDGDSGSLLASMSLCRFCEAALTSDGFWNTWLKWVHKRDVLDLIIMHHTNTVPKDLL